MARGNEREKAREKAQAKLAAANKGNKQSGSGLAKTKEEQAAIMRAKQEAAEAKKNGTAAK